MSLFRMEIKKDPFFDINFIRDRFVLVELEFFFLPFLSLSFSFYSQCIVQLQQQSAKKKN